MSRTPRTLVLGWGNPGRGDDALGPALARMLARAQEEAGVSHEGPGPGECTVTSDYQLQIEDAAEIARHERVVFVDADRSGPEPFSCRRLSPSDRGLSFTSHSVTPGALLTLARELFGGRPEAWMLGIRGYDFDEFEETLSSRARDNLTAASTFLRKALAAGSIEEVPAIATPDRKRHERKERREDVT